ncbi:DUF418 domain-containing protein [Saccharothrix violaceirubra]|uniref:DUF418 domain-containing protein n=1 Tax=Saccharothrix violaceirubra TaxID=413306 RepID=A0A7W7T5Z7_9PSEU|nr:DUF418 domain-containing protein [Saccharothrix violaceirubra]MBB4967208.1 uncharacterized protein [Saccharothrix violaceirubra]
MGRIVALDVLRGVAILGTLGTNIWIFTDPAGPSGFFAGGGTAETALTALSNGKFLGLLSILFGIGLAVQHRSAVRRGTRWPGRYLWRSTLLLVEGALHYVLVFEFDVLMFYAMVSVVVAFLVGRPDRVVRRWLVAFGALHLAVVGLLTVVLMGAGDLGPPTATYPTDSWTAQVATRIELIGVFRAEGVLVLPLSTVLFLIGILLFRAGALEDSVRGRRLQHRLALAGLGVGLPLNALSAFAPGQWFLVDRYVCAPFVALGLLGAITALVHRMGEPGPIRTGLTSVGRTALSCYIAQNVLAAALCYGWGLDLTAAFGRFGAAYTVAVWLVIATFLLVAATWWTKRFRRGPVEWVWDLAYRAPGRRRVASTA